MYNYINRNKQITLTFYLVYIRYKTQGEKRPLLFLYIGYYNFILSFNSKEKDYEKKHI